MYMYPYDLSEWIANYPTQLCIIPAVIGAGAAIVGGAMKLFGGSSKQKRDQAFQREMWQKQVEQQDKVNAQQMAYQDKVNAENRAWSNEAAVRERVEAAGYNPYLYNGQAAASSANIASSTNLGNSVTAPANNTSENLLEGPADALSQVGNYMAQGLAYEKADYDFGNQKAADSITNAATGAKAGAQAQETLNRLEQSKQAARVDAATAFATEIQNAMSQLQAYDANGVPMVDESSGRPVTLAEQRARGENVQLFKTIDKLTQDIINGKVTEKNLNIEYLTKKYNLENLMPEQLQILQQQLVNLRAEYDKINAETRVLGSQFELNKSTTRLNDQNVQTQQRYAELLGQQKLTEEQKTAISKIEAFFGSTERAVGIIKNIRPSSQAEVLHYVATGVGSLLSGGKFHSAMTDEQVASKLLDLTHQELANDAKAKKAASKKAR